MKNLFYVFTIALLSVFSLCSCGGDDEIDPSSPQGIKKALVGAWKTSMASSNWKTICIKPGGAMKYDYLTKEELKKYTYDEEKNEYVYYWQDDRGENYGVVYHPEDNSKWVFDESQSAITMFRDDGYYTFTYKVVMSDDQNSWVGTDSNGRTCTFVRIEE